MIIDTHTHIFPDKIAPKVMEMNEKGLGLPSYGTGTRQGLLTYMDEAGIDASFALGVAPEARLVRSTNDWLLGLSHPRIIVFGSLTPDYEAWKEEIDRLKAGGARGIKINSLLQEIIPDDPRMYPIYERLTDAGMVIYFHSGKGEGENSQVPLRATPKNLRKVHDDFPRLTMIIAHFGGYGMLSEVNQHLLGQDVFFDTSYCPTVRDLDRKEMTRLIRAHGVEHILYGTDYPWGKQATTIGWEYQWIRELALNDSEKEMILGKNAESLIHM